MLASLAMLGVGLPLSPAGEGGPASRYACKDVSELLNRQQDETPPLPPRPRAGGPEVKSVSELLAARKGESSVGGETSAPLPPTMPDLSLPVSPTGRRSLPSDHDSTGPGEGLAGRASVSLESASPEGPEAAFEPVPLPPWHEPSTRTGRNDRGPTPNALTASTVLDLRVTPVIPPSPNELPPDKWRSQESGKGVSSATATTTVVPSSPSGPGEASARNGTEAPLFEAGVFRSDALFSGVPTVVGELAPTPIGGDESTSRQALAALPPSLAPQPLLNPSGTEAFTQRDYLGGERSPPPPSSTPEAEPLTPERLRQIGQAADELHRPLNSIRMAQHLEGRHPPDLAAQVHPSLQPDLLWGAPWPSDPLRWYRYTVPFEHRPLYFEQPNLERCGLHWGPLTPYASAAHFFGNIVLLPVHAVIDLPCVPVPTLGDCPAGCSYGLCPTLNRCR